MSECIRIGTRGSKLALWQAEWVANRLRERSPGTETGIEVITTAGDKVQDRPLAALGVKGSFTKELDRALLACEIDMAVHSLKDMPTELERGLVLAAVPEREDAHDVFIGKRWATLAELPEGAVIGTGSLRRRAQLRAVRPDAESIDIRGNIDTRIRKLRESSTLEGIILAAAGVIRLGLSNEISSVLEYGDWLPAPGQGALGVVIRDGLPAVLEAAALLDDPSAHVAVMAERALLARIEGGCHVPVGAYARIEAGNLVLDGLIADPDGGQVVRAQLRGVPDSATDIGTALAETLLSDGGARILAACEPRV